MSECAILFCLQTVYKIVSLHVSSCNVSFTFITISHITHGLPIVGRIAVFHIVQYIDKQALKDRARWFSVKLGKLQYLQD